MEKSKIIIFKEKHGDKIYFISTKEDLYNVSLYVLKERLENGYISDWGECPLDNIDFNLDDIDALPKSLQDEAMKKLKYHNEKINSYEHNNKIYDLTLKAINENDGKLAYKVLNYRIDYNYEEFEIVEPITINSKKH